jgi:hypothetical protein
MIFCAEDRRRTGTESAHDRAAVRRHVVEVGGDPVTQASRLDFRIHLFRLGSEDAARVDFHRMLTALIQVQHPSATEVRPNPGDWGIDTFVGSLVDKVNIWQSKYFVSGIGDSQKRQIRESLNSAMRNAAKNGYQVESWTLCAPLELTAPERQWWDRKVREWKKDHPGVVFDLWDPPRLRTFLMAPDADLVLQEFYGPQRVWAPATAGLTSRGVVATAIVERPAGHDYDGALFVVQLTEAGLTEIDDQKTAFFNAEVLARDVANRGVPEELYGLTELDASAKCVWEERVAAAGTPADGLVQPHAQALFAAVMREVRQLPAPPHLPVRPVHSAGMMHRVVESRRAGWVVHWRDVAARHAGARDESDAAVTALAGAP